MKTIVCFLVSFFGFVACYSQYPYQIDAYNVEISLNKNSSIDVTETIRVTFNESRRGIFRSIPYVLPGRAGLTRSVTLDSISVGDGTGYEAKTKITTENGYVKIRIGDANVWMSPGTEKTYTIKYRIIGAINWFEATNDWKEAAELYWNILGDEWDTTIANFTFTVQFPEVKSDSDVRAKLFSGAYGSRLNTSLLKTGAVDANNETGCWLKLGRNRFDGGSNKIINPYEGISIVLDVPASLIDKLGFWESLGIFLKGNLGFLLIPFTFLSMVFFWLRFGRDPDTGPTAVQYDPPDNLSGPEAGALIDETVDQKDIAAGIISLAVKGKLIIEFGEEVGMIFKRRPVQLKPLDTPENEPLTAFESKLFGKIRSAGDLVTETELKTHVAPHISELRESLYDSLVTRRYYKQNPNSVRWTWMILGVLVVAFLAFLSTKISPIPSPTAAIIGGVVSGIIVLLFGWQMPKRTFAGARALREVRSFEEFIRRARGDELDWMSKKHPDQALFEKYLPHAVAFGLTAEWSEAFKNIALENPSWYHDPYGARFNYLYFSRDFDNMTNSVASAASVPPRSSGGSGGSSGFGGGGFSGGGFGGGGGGSW